MKSPFPASAKATTRMPSAPRSGTPTPDRLLKIAQAFRHGATVEQIFASCKYEPWFLRQIEEIVQMEDEDPRTRPAERRGQSAQAQGHGLFRQAAGRTRRPLRRQGPQRIATSSKVRPVFKRIDTCAAEFASPTAYMYSTYETGLPVTRQRGAGPPTSRRSSSSAAGQTASARASSSTIAAAMPASRCMTRAMNRSWSTATRKPCRPTTTPRTVSISNR